jgi:hypothetical protein
VLKQYLFKKGKSIGSGKRKNQQIGHIAVIDLEGCEKRHAFSIIIKDGRKPFGSS